MHADIASLLWVITGYSLTLGSLLLIEGVGASLLFPA
jgi:hypothetical protein